ncbi:hypothetical protein LPB140_09760 [Sphingorhabdus lutea]|uniref:Trypsin-like peptidase domain-containing protein n=1 Tax=Sphingorhabdus lutea TaxID=1913578 RepID=A0A1L3JD19_9SPHN|nr:serine protease [Sphingorhabdus lutea]APG63026.1 hypothetical protein LPB140_09760 [Sphingorhabdus lutea]
MAKLIQIICLYTALFFHIGAAQAESQDISAASRSVVRVVLVANDNGRVSYVGHGSGVAISPNLVITNAHVVEALQYDPNIVMGVVPSEGKQSYAATVIAIDPSKDLALVKISQGRLTAATIYSGPLTDGSDVFAIGYPGTVDNAQGLDFNDLIRPQAAVKTRGSYSQGRSAKMFETILHTAPIGGGNSGGPLVDNCGRVIGINSFSSVSNGNDAEFFFAISMRELTNFLRKAKITLPTVNSMCRSVSELTAAEKEREAAEQAKMIAAEQAKMEAAGTAKSQMRRKAELDILSERENIMALSGLLILIALAGFGGSYILFQKGKREHAIIAIGIGAILILAAIYFFMNRPGFNEIENRMAEMAKQDKQLIGADNQGDDTSKENDKAPKEGVKICILQPERSRLTVSNGADVSFDWKSGGCINGRTQYAANGSIWTRSFVPNQDSSLSVISFDASKNNYKIERYLLGMEAMDTARTARQRYDVKSCTNDAASLDKITQMNNAIKEVLPSEPNELLNFKCSDK